MYEFAVGTREVLWLRRKWREQKKNKNTSIIVKMSLQESDMNEKEKLCKLLKKNKKKTAERLIC